ncbi:MAG: hypothetical protein ACKO5C_05525, partial [Ferruginibacter sp.]
MAADQSFKINEGDLLFEKKSYHVFFHVGMVFSVVVLIRFLYDKYQEWNEFNICPQASDFVVLLILLFFNFTSISDFIFDLKEGFNENTYRAHYIN